MFDLHVHAAPDVTERIGSDADIGGAYREAGFTGFVLKAHHESTVGRAAAVARTTGLDVVGGVVLNRPAGGVNAAAVLATLRSGGRVVWFPTADAHTQQDAALPRLADLDERVGRAVLAVPPVLSPEPGQLEEIALVLDLVAEHDALLCSGHLGRDECAWLLAEARARGIRRFLLTHPSYTVPAMGPAEIGELAEQGAHVEITAYQLWGQPGMTDEKLAAVARAAGDRLVLSSDAGQVDSPSPPEALGRLVERLRGLGLDSGLLRAAASDVPRTLVL